MYFLGLELSWLVTWGLSSDYTASLNRGGNNITVKPIEDTFGYPQ